ncbi:MAG TPA: FHA domain-containing protein, partial [Ktedonobacterales bacterium]
ERVSAEIDWDRELEAAYEAVHGAEGDSQDQPEAIPQALLAAPAADVLHFMVCAPASIAAETWETLLFYTHVPAAMNDAYQDAAQHTQHVPDRRYTAIAPTDHPLARGVELTIVPQGPGLTFNPPRLAFRWLEDWHQAPFRFSASRALAGTDTEVELTIYAGVLTLATVKVTLFCGDTSTSSPQHLPASEGEADASLQEATCFRCGAVNPPGRRFCLICNYDLTPRVVPNLLSPQETWLPFVHARLTLMDNPSSGQYFNLHEHTITTIGRAPGNDIILSDPSISRHHAQLHFESGRWILEDKNSSLGTYVNGRRIRWPQPIADGDQLRLAHTILLFNIVG